MTQQPVDERTEELLQGARETLQKFPTTALKRKFIEGLIAYAELHKHTANVAALRKLLAEEVNDS